MNKIDWLIGFIALMIILTFGGLLARNMEFSHERKLRIIEGCSTITDQVAKADCYTGDVWE